MAGYLIVQDDPNQSHEYQFNLDEPNLTSKLAQANNSARVMILQLDGDELAAALWGLKNYNNEVAGYLIVHSERPHVRILDKDRLNNALRSLSDNTKEEE